ncbi:enoyl-CoA hydratase/isomerase family protein [Aestuariibacter sp. A3R04]|uniref:enoyl-CoA hydratase/isomerase family protein n=1 Tax=Aestuariibacter sp. A3R04 TaxID=2841571 RepID=UPI001C085A0E|nr:enoyl-CoA hydratase/isomerase family protein [Aestuariibacter sp. A3R04]MBU3022680.1 enoyl-CoA hydratase/isomerase family protein [Aestuariibacter sp. A3R04]
MTAQDSVRLDIDSRGVASLRLNRPDKHNAFDDSVIARLTTHLDDIENNDAIRVVIVCSTGTSFSAGADLNWMKRMANYSAEENQRDAEALATMLDKLNRLSKPTIARVQGAAFGGAIGIIACCDMAIATKLSKFCLSEVRLGLIPATISPYVIEAMGARVCRRYFQTAEVFSARRARRLGLISECVSEAELDIAVETLTDNLLKNGPCAMTQAKRLIATVGDQPVSPELLLQTSRLIADIRVSEEGQEGLQAFLQKRAPAWRGHNND